MAMEASSGSNLSLEDLLTAFNSKISSLQHLLVLRNPVPSSTSADFASLDIYVRAMEQQLGTIKAHVKDEMKTLPKAKALVALSLRQARRLEHISANFSAQLHVSDQCTYSEQSSDSVEVEQSNGVLGPVKSSDTAPQREKKGRNPPPRLYVTVDELDSLSSYMRGRLTLEKINLAVDEMATFAEANARLLAAPRKKLADDMLEKVLELRDFAASEAVKGKYFFFESDMRGPILKLDNTGKAILTVLRHLNRISEVRAGRQRAFILTKS